MYLDKDNITMIPFLKSVAAVYMNNYSDLTDVCFVFPNKRSGTFFSKYLKDVAGKNSFVAPHITTISDLVASMSGLVIDSRIDLIFSLYSIYRDMQNVDVEFDRFRTWGEMVLADFNDVEMYMVDAEQLFKNLSDLKNIESNYLTDEQLEVMRDYFGITDYENDRKSFWTQFSSDKLSENKQKFLKLWEILSPLHKRLKDNLEQRGLAFAGMAYRRALDNLRSQGTDLLPYKRIVMVGFNALSTVEWNIFKELKKLKINDNGIEVPFADFYWNCTGIPMNNEANSATHFVKNNIETFPSIFDISESDVEGMPDVLKVISAPSNVGQVKIASMLMSEIKRKLSETGESETSVAVVLPDEELVIPMVYSLPEDIKDVNLTMGYSLRMTMASTFMNLIRRLQMRKRRLNGIDKFFHEDVKALLMHPYTAGLVTLEELNSLRNDMAKLRKYMVSVEDMNITLPKLLELFKPISNDAGIDAITEYLDKNMANVAESIEYYQVGNELVRKRLDLTHIDSYRDALRRLKKAADDYQISLSAADIFSMIDRLLGGESVRFEGEPLTGMQILGPLETRCLDFKYLIILSMNERIYPRKLKNRSFIPAILHHGYGMPTTRFQESIFAYNFYSMISRCKEVYMIYDARTEGMKSGEVSRYIRQLQYLYAPDNITFKNYRFELTKEEPAEIVISKSPDVIDSILKYFTPGTDKYFSPTAIEAYLECPLKFYLLYVHGLNEPKEPKEFMGADTLGIIVHGVMERIYRSANAGKARIDKPIRITKAFLSGFTKDILNEIISDTIKKCYIESKSAKETPAEVELYAKSIYNIIERTLRHDLELVPFDYYGSEIKETHTFKLTDGSGANVKYVIDRIDSCGDKYRIVDYKTGKYELKVDTLEDIFDPGTGTKALFQLMYYTYMLRSKHKISDHISMEIYDMQKMDTTEEKGVRIPKLSSANEFPTDEHWDEFKELLNDKFLEIKNPDIPICQTTNNKLCTYCPLKQTICHR